MRMILLRVSGAKSHEDLRTYQNVQYPSFKQTAIEMGLLDTDSEWINTLQYRSNKFYARRRIEKIFRVHSHSVSASKSICSMG